jgi:hypothetical protein
MARNNGGWSPRDIKPGGWLVILLIIGAVYWFEVKPHIGTLQKLPTFTLPPLPFGNQTSSTPPTSQSTFGSATGSDILVLTTGTKKKWLNEEIDKFNSQSSSGHAELDIYESRQGMQKILAGAEQPDIWSPSSTVWTDRLADIGPANNIHIHEDNDDYRTLFESPLVFLVVKSQLDELTPILTARHPFSRLSQLHRYKFAYANPLNASSGMLTMTLLLNEYADIHNVDDLDKVANSSGFASWLRKVDEGLETQNTQGSSQLESDFESNPGDRSFITAYEGTALQAVINNPNLAIIYPNPTADASQVAVIVNGPWTTDAKAATAKAFLNFIMSDDAYNDATDLYFRPSLNGGSVLAQKLQNTAAASYFQTDFRTVDLPSYDAINDANVVWHEQEP